MHTSTRLLAVIKRSLLIATGMIGTLLVPEESSAQSDPGNAVISLHCVNPGKNISFDRREFLGNGLGQASSDPVQFNINQEPGTGAIFVNPHNDGVCTAQVSSNHIVTKAWTVLVPGGSSTEQRTYDSVPEDWINSRVSLPAVITGNRTVVFSVHSLQPDSPTARKGSVTTTFFLQYRRSN